MPRLIVTPLSQLEDTIAAQRPSHIVTLLSPGHMIETPSGFPAERHLKLGVNDIVDIAAGTHPPDAEHVERLLAFSRGWDAAAPMIIHCWAGISRSMASAFIVLSDRLGPGSETAIATAMRRRAPHAAPNKLLVRHGDALLQRDGRMIAAVDAMSPAEILGEGAPTQFPLVDL
jgi:predicted protein tyrosine phosphatase